MAQHKIMVTGGAGFIGSHLCRRLLDDGHEVLCIDNLLTGHRDNLKELRTNRNFKLLQHDITTPFHADVDQIYNLACPASPRHYQTDPVHTAKTSALGAIHLLELASRTNARILQASTSEVYGDPEVHPQAENYWGRVNPIGLRSCYDEGKRYAEALFFDYCRQFQTDIRVVRIFNTYGPRMQSQDGRVVSNFICQALQHKNITIYGDGLQTRSFQFIDDLIEGLVRMMDQSTFIGPVNLGNPQEITVRHLAEKILALIPRSRSRIIYRSLPEDDPRQRRPDIALAWQKLQWRPVVNLDQGLQRTIDYFRAVC